MIAGVFLGVVQGNSGSDGAISIGTLATILTVAGVATYVLGLIGLAVTIRLRLARDIPTAWYAVSLLPRTIVAGQGIRIWLGWPIGITVVISVGIYLMRALALNEETAFKLVLISVGAVLLLFYVLSIRAVTRAGFPDSSNVSFVRNRKRPFMRKVAKALMVIFWFLLGTLNGAVLLAGSSIMWAAGLLIMRGLGYEYANGFLNEIIPIGLTVPQAYSTLVGAITLFVGGFIVGLPSALLKKPPLPRIQLTKKPGGSTTARELPDSITCNLVTHSSDGLWHVFDDTCQLWAIPDDEVLLARIPGVPTTTPAAQRHPVGVEGHPAGEGKMGLLPFGALLVCYCLAWAFSASASRTRRS